MPNGESVSIDRKLRFYLHPFRLPHEAAFVMRFATRDGSLGGEFDIVAGPTEEDDEGAVITKFGGRNDVATCITTLRAGRDIVFGLRDERESLVNFLLPNDDKFQPLYDETIQRLQQRTAMNQVLRYNAELQRKRGPRPEPMKARRIDLAIVIFPQDKDDGTFGVRLMAIFDSGDIAGEIDWNGDDFLVARTATLDSAITYSKDLSDILGLKVLQLQKS